VISGEDIAHCISNPHEIKQEDLSAFADLVKKYPYASCFHLLELKGLALANSIDFEPKLKSTAIHAPDRGHLYAFIHSGAQESTTKVQDEPIAIKENIIVEAPDEAMIQNTESIKESAVHELEETLEELPIAEAVIEVTESFDESELTNEITENVDIQPDEELPVARPLPKFNIASELDVDILNKAIDIAYVSSEIENNDIIENTEVSNNEEVITETPIAETIITTEETIELDASADIEKRDLTFIEWLRLKQTLKAEEIEFTKKLTPIDSPESSQEIEEKSEEVEEKVSPKIAPRKKDIDALLDKFMQEEPRISRPVKDFYNPVKSARKSVEESDDMVTETLAKIHVLQKNYSKAISAYEKLILLYPEKKAFFASRIEKIREESKKR
jgi:hypothetical protein